MPPATTSLFASAGLQRHARSMPAQFSGRPSAPLHYGGRRSGAGGCVPVSVAQPQEHIALVPPPPRRVAILVEPSPFSHVSGYQNRFQNLIRGLRDHGDSVLVVTPDKNPPKDFHGAEVVNVLGFSMPLYNSPTLLLSLGLSVRVLWHLVTRRPDVIHVSTPGVLVFAAVLYSKLLSIPLVMSYHTHMPEYIPKYTWKGLVAPMWAVIRWCTRRADLTLVTSKVMKDELDRNHCHSDRIDVWQRGVDTTVFSPEHRSDAMRERMTGGHTGDTLMVYVGRLGAEKNLKALKQVLQQSPGCRLAFVGDGPERAALEQEFAGLPVVFTGMLRGLDLSAAYASADVFVMPSESETLGFVVLEAMASGLPVVAVRAGGIPDIVTRPGETGFLYEPGNLQQAAELVRRLAADVQLRRQVGDAARAEVERWGWGAATRRLRDQQYTQAIVNRSQRKRSPLWRFAAWLASGWGALALLAAALLRYLDYARDYRGSNYA